MYIFRYECFYIQFVRSRIIYFMELFFLFGVVSPLVTIYKENIHSESELQVRTAIGKINHTLTCSVLPFHLLKFKLKVCVVL